MTKGRDRVVSVPLSEAEWKAFIERHPAPVDWLRAQILAAVEDARDLPKPQAAIRPSQAWSTRRV